MMHAPATGTPIDRGQVRRLLLVELNRMGDVVHALPAARAMRGWLPEAELAMLVDARYDRLAKLEACVDRVMTSEHSNTVLGLVRTARQVRRERFDLVCSLSPIRRNALVTILGRTRYAAGYLSVGRRTPNFLRKTRVRSLGFTLYRQETYGFDHISEAPRRVCRALGVDSDDFALPPPGQSAGAHGTAGNAYVVIHPFAGWAFREWPPEAVPILVREILDKTSASVALIGSDHDVDRLDMLMRPFSKENRVRSYAGLPLDKLAGLIRGAKLFVGTDSGPYQLSEWLQTPSIGLFGPAPPEITGSRRATDRKLYHRLDCSPCDQRRCVRPDNPCMHRIAVPEVAAHVWQMLTPNG